MFLNRAEQNKNTLQNGSKVTLLRLCICWLFSFIMLHHPCSSVCPKAGVKLHCFYFTFLHCVFSNVSSNCLSEKMYSHIGCIYLTFLLCEFSNVPAKNLDQSMQSHIGYICLTFLHCAFSNVSSNCLAEKM